MDARVIVGIVAGLLTLWVAVIVALWLLRPRGMPLRDLIALGPDTVRLVRSLVGDRTVPLDVRVVLAAMVLWILSPIDLIPEFVPVIGPMDDIVVAILALRYARRRVGAEELGRRWTGGADRFALLGRVIGAKA